MTRLLRSCLHVKFPCGADQRKYAAASGSAIVVVSGGFAGRRYLVELV
ncbi:MAG: hypothetical protein ABJP79_00540 [Tateyamaria sp.]